MEQCRCDHYVGYVCRECREMIVDKPLCSVVIRGQGPRSGEVDFVVNEEALVLALQQGRMAEVNAAFWATGKRITDIQESYRAANND